MKAHQPESTPGKDDPFPAANTDQKILKSGSFNIQSAEYHLLNEEAETAEKNARNCPLPPVYSSCFSRK